MTIGKYSGTFKVNIEGVRLKADASAIATLSGQPATLTITPSEEGLTLQIEINTDNPEGAHAVARACARRFTEWLMLRFAHLISHALEANYLNHRFQTGDANRVQVFAADVIFVGEAMTALLTTYVPAHDVADMVRAFAGRESAPPPVFAAEILVAREMYFAGLRVSNAVARFLIFYSALAVVASFKLGKKGGQTQADIDRLLLGEDPLLHYVPPPGRTQPETEFTRARNEFIHAEDRGRDPGAAMSKMTSLMARFQSLVASVLLKG